MTVLYLAAGGGARATEAPKPAQKPAAAAPKKPVSARTTAPKAKTVAPKTTATKTPVAKSTTAKKSATTRKPATPTKKKSSGTATKSRTTAKKPPAKPAPAKPAPPAAPIKTEPLQRTMMILPPETRAEDTADSLFGTMVPDPYRWLEDDNASEVKSWTQAQNAFTAATLGGVPGRTAIRERLTRLLAIGTVSAPTVRNGRYFFLKREGEQNQPLLYLRPGPGQPARVLLDPNKLSKDGTTSLDWYFPSLDGTKLAYGLSVSGNERSVLHVLDVGTGQDLPDRINDCRAASVAWEPDGQGFYYTRYPKKGSVPAGEENYNRRVFHHRLGDDVSDDAAVFGAGRAPQDWPSVDLSRDGRWLLVSVSVGWTRNDVYLKDLQKPGADWVTLAEKKDSLYGVDVVGADLFVTTNEGAPRFRVFRATPERPERAAWKEIIPQGEAVLESITPIGGRLCALYQKDATSVMTVFDFAGQKLRDLALPAPGSASGMSGEPDGQEGFFSFSSTFVPPTVFRYDLTDESLTVSERVDTDIKTDRYEMKQVWYASKDGTQIPLFIVARKGLVLDGRNPCWLNGYGGFNVSTMPAFQRNVFLWLEQGGVYAMACLRGGGEYGETWHEAGMRGKKQNVFDDFIAAGEYLIAGRYTSAAKLAIQGGSNGGLLVGAVLTQRPDLCRAVVCQVPLLDMIRYHKFLIAKLWVPEYGSADDPAQFHTLWTYSPYHRVVEGRNYPAVLLATAESDSRVAPLHARKMAARLQAATGSGLPVLLRIEAKAGHGAGKPITKVVDEYTDIYSFLFSQLGMTYKESM